MSNNKDIESGSAPQGASQPSALARYGLPIGLFGASVILGIALPVCLHNKTQTDLKDLEKKLGKAQYEELLKKTEELTKRVNSLEAQKPKTIKTNNIEIQTDKPKTIKPKTIKPKTIKPKTIQTNTIDVQTDNIQTTVIETQTTNPIQVDLGTDPGMDIMKKIMKGQSEYQKAFENVRKLEWETTKKDEDIQNHLIEQLRKIFDKYTIDDLTKNFKPNKATRSQIYHLKNMKTKTTEDELRKVLRKVIMKKPAETASTYEKRSETIRLVLENALRNAIKIELGSLFTSADKVMKAGKNLTRNTPMDEYNKFFAEETDDIKRILETEVFDQILKKQSKEQKRISELKSFLQSASHLNRQDHRVLNIEESYNQVHRTQTPDQQQNQLQAWGMLKDVLKKVSFIENDHVLGQEKW